MQSLVVQLIYFSPDIIILVVKNMSFEFETVMKRDMNKNCIFARKKFRVEKSRGNDRMIFHAVNTKFSTQA